MMDPDRFLERLTDRARLRFVAERDTFDLDSREDGKGSSVHSAGPRKMGREMIGLFHREDAIQDSRLAAYLVAVRRGNWPSVQIEVLGPVATPRVLTAPRSGRLGAPHAAFD